MSLALWCIGLALVYCAEAYNNTSNGYVLGYILVTWLAWVII